MAFQNSFKTAALVLATSLAGCAQPERRHAEPNPPLSDLFTWCSSPVCERAKEAPPTVMELWGALPEKTRDHCEYVATKAAEDIKWYYEQLRPDGPPSVKEEFEVTADVAILHHYYERLERCLTATTVPDTHE
jgi:hypothetical protein